MNTLNLLWLDLETTGLNPETDKILQVGVAVTNEKLDIVAEREWVVKWDTRVLDMDEVVHRMHSKSGLLTECAFRGMPLNTVFEQLTRFIATHFPDANKKPYLAGNSVHFDRAMLQANRPEILKLLHYRMLDVSSFKVAAEIQGLPPYAKAKAHTALADIVESIREYKHWREAFAVRRAA